MPARQPDRPRTALSRHGRVSSIASSGRCVAGSPLPRGFPLPRGRLLRLDNASSSSGRHLLRLGTLSTKTTAWVSSSRAPAARPMTSHTGRLYALAVSLAAFFVLWAVIAARPWLPTAAGDPRLAALDQRALILRRQAAIVDQIVSARRSAAQSAARRIRQSATTAPAPVRVVTLPPVVVTRTS